MTWRDGIATAVLIAFALLILIDQRKQRSTTHTQNTRRTEHGHDPTDTHRKGHQPGTRHTGQEDRG